jgi:hypothetical protein
MKGELGICGRMRSSQASSGQPKEWGIQSILLLHSQIFE